MVLTYNLPGIHSLKLSLDQIVRIFTGDLEWWNDTTLQDFNARIRLPNKQIIPIARRDGSGSTKILTDGLSVFSETWDRAYGAFNSPNLAAPDGPSEVWPPAGPDYFALKGEGMVNLEAVGKHNTGREINVYAHAYNAHTVNFGGSLETEI